MSAESAGQGPGRRRPVVRRVPVEREVDDELAFHVEMRTRQLVAEGMTEEAARASAIGRFGDLGQVTRTCRRIGRGRERDMRLAEWINAVRQDLVYATRQLRRAPGFTLAATVTLALAIGATAAIFSVVDAVVLRRLSVPHQERIVRLLTTRAEGGPQPVAPATYEAWREQGQDFRYLAAVDRTGFTLSGAGDRLPELLNGAQVTADYFRVYGVAPMLGRAFLPEEQAPGRNRVVVLSARTWRRRFGGDSAVVGRTIRLDAQAYTVVGVMPPALDLTATSDQLWMPLVLPTDERHRRAGFLEVYGQLRPGVSPAQARATLSAAAAAARLTSQSPDPKRGAGSSVRLIRLIDDLAGEVRPRLLTLLGAVAFVLLIGCANVANLQLARGAARAKELAIRTAIGAGRGRIVRQLVTESLLLGLLGGAIGLALARFGIRALVALSPAGVARLEQASVDARTLAFTFGLVLASTVLFGLVPALRLTRRDLQPSLREGGRGDALGATRDWTRSALVVAEVALALVLLAGAGLLVRSAILLQRVDPGFTPAGVLTARIFLPEARYREAPAIVRAYDEILAETRRLPGLRSASLVLMVPFADGGVSGSPLPEGKPWTDEARVSANLRLAGPGYFETMRIPMRRGREFSERDGEAAPRVAIINETLARRLWPGQDAVGRRISGVGGSADDPKWLEVVGVAGDVRGEGLAQPTRSEFYVPVAQTPPGLWSYVQRSLVLVARGGADPAALERPLRRAIARVDADLPVTDVRTMDAYRAESLATSRFSTWLLTALSLIGLVLAAVGIYGVIAWFVTQHTREIGIRMALGATPGRVQSLVVRRGLAPVVAGVVLGTALAMAATRLLGALLYETSPADPLTLTLVVVLLVGVALLACLVPAWRATRVDPALVMRS